MIKIPAKIEGACLLKPKVYRDERGFFLESWNRETFRSLGIDVDFVQDNHSRSSLGVLRGLHYQVGIAAQGKLVRVTSGKVFDVIVDLRRNSATFGRWDGYYLCAEDHMLLWIPPGCAHGFLVMSETADFHYKCTALYDSSAESTLKWDDAELAIVWPEIAGVDITLSPKDLKGLPFSECEKYD